MVFRWDAPRFFDGRDAFFCRKTAKIVEIWRNSVFFRDFHGKKLAFTVFDGKSRINSLFSTKSLVRPKEKKIRSPFAEKIRSTKLKHCFK